MYNHVMTVYVAINVVYALATFGLSLALANEMTSNQELRLGFVSGFSIITALFVSISMSNVMRVLILLQWVPFLCTV